MMRGSVRDAHAALFAAGERLPSGDTRVEDAAEVHLDLDDGRVIRLACSWNLHAGQDAVIEARFHGTDGGAAMLNSGGSFYDFRAELYHGTRRSALAEPPDRWGGRAIVDWAKRLAESPVFDPSVEQVVTVSEVLDRIYGR